MPHNCPDKNPLVHQGLSQPQRLLAALEPGYARLDERTLEDLLQFTAKYAEAARIRFFDTRNLPDNGEAWASLMNYKNYLDLQELEKRHDIEPHMALLLSFLKLYGHLQDHQNTLTKRHLDFYYKEVLQLTNQAPVPDKAHVLFELAKNAAKQIVAEDTELDAGKDLLKKPLLYHTQDNLTVNQAKIAFLHTLYIHTDNKLYYAPAADTSDGVAEPLDPENPTWNPFGPKPKPAVSCGAPTPATINLPEAQVGFALASPVLLLAEGERKITVTITLKATLALPAAPVKLQVQLSGAKAWIEAGEATLAATGLTLTFTVTISKEEKEAVVAYDPAKLDGAYITNFPVMRCLLADTATYESLKKAAISSIKIDTEVSGLKKSLQLENDLGRVSSEKPFMPFGPTPAVGAALYVGCQEALQKKLEWVKVHLQDWVGKPAAWSTYYAAYGTPYNTESNMKATVEVINGNLRNNASASKTLFTQFAQTDGVQVPATPSSAPAAASGGFATGGSYKYYGNYQISGGVYQLQTPLVILPLQQSAPPPTVSDSLLRLVLKQDFGHSVYPKKLTQAVLDQVDIAKTPKQAVPNPPYTPLVKELLLSYKATTGTINLSDAGTPHAFSNRSFQLLHLGAFGYAEEHPFLKAEFPFLDSSEKATTTLLPQYRKQGTFLVGLQDARPREAVTFLFQVADGSANPERQVATIQWSVLCRNQWYQLGVEQIISDSTNQLLQSGIIRFYLPAETSTANTLMAPGYTWLKAELVSEENPEAVVPIDSISNLVALHTQAVTAIFEDNGNDPSHYNMPLPAETIRKLRQPLPALKGVKQPYPSFGGKAAETDEAFYTRVSERLRHKQRALSIWDYEHLVLQHFPDVYKVKCLNHTRIDDAKKLHELAPGYVTVVVVPDLRNANAINPHEPKVSLRLLHDISTYLQRHAGKLVRLQVVNPGYERVQLNFKVQFLPGYEFAVYRKELQREIIAYLSPWAYNASSDIPFGGTLQKSVIINYIERVKYVDFVTDFRMKQFINGISTPDDSETITASDARAVLVSCSGHIINEYTGC